MDRSLSRVLALPKRIYLALLPDLDPERARFFFRLTAFAEAASWLALLIAMYLKWIVADDPNAGAEGGVPIVGPIHGVMFLAYVVACLSAHRTFRWNTRTLLVALACSIPPLTTVVFEVLADRRGLLGRDAEHRSS